MPAPDPTVFTKLFPNEGACIEFLEKAKFPEGKVRSPFTGGEAYTISTRPGIYKCKESRQTFSVRHGTIFEDSRLKLRKWFFAIYLVHSVEGEMTSAHLGKALGVTQRTAWFMLDRIRYAMTHAAFADVRNSSVATTLQDP